MNGRWTYNAKDTIATRAVFDAIHPLLDEQTRRVYEANMGLQGAMLGVQMRGIRVDPVKRERLAQELEEEAHAHTAVVSEIAGESMTGKKGSISVKKLKALLYDKIGVANLYDDEGKLTTGEKALQKIAERKVALKPHVPNSERSERKDLAAKIAMAVLESRDKFKQVGTLRTPLTDGRMRFTLVVGGTESMRLSSHKSHDGTGTNIQNQDKRLRGIYIPDDGFVFMQRDQKQAESLTVAYLSGDPEYIRAHEAGNTHVYVGRNVLFPELPWPDDPKAAKAFAETARIPHYMGEVIKGGPGSAYYASKRIQHGLNYLLSARGLAVHSGLPVVAAETAYQRYYGTFTRIKEWHRKVIDEVRSTGMIQYPGGWRRVFFGRLNDEGTWREAISSIPQATIAWTNHIVFFRLYYELDGPDFQVLMHGHDSVLAQVREDKVQEYRERSDALSRVEWPIEDRTLVVPWDVEVGYNWQEMEELK